MEEKKTAVFGIYASVAEAEQAVDALAQSGFPRTDISVLLQEPGGSGDMAHRKETKAPEGTAIGATTGGLIVGALGVLTAIGTLAIPGFGPLLAAGPVVAGLAGLGAGGAVGGLIGALVGMGIPEYVAKRYEGHVRNGGVLLSVHCGTSEDVSRAKNMLAETGAEDISSTGEQSEKVRTSGSH